MGRASFHSNANISNVFLMRVSVVGFQKLNKRLMNVDVTAAARQCSWATRGPCVHQCSSAVSRHIVVFGRPETRCGQRSGNLTYLISPFKSIKIRFLATGLASTIYFLKGMMIPVESPDALLLDPLAIYAKTSLYDINVVL